MTAASTYRPRPVITADTIAALKLGFEVRHAANGGMVVLQSQPDNGRMYPSNVLGAFTSPQDMLDWLVDALVLPDEAQNG
ncbi:hypothetical protein GCM10007913_12070 [Devosia yakushimensis]|uniref:Uncharacterized protein n=1 Tax=Devosia yakushimensis TaxID=470028 RepID=A0ABQ5UC12_9HYPH|nr:hypothetical protein [Devosia yakushimensis]GLQ09275.1 hypothetical protein GCM10007913_12070 [Devosia yakushimensis]